MDIVYLLVYFTSGILAMTCVSQLIDTAVTDGKVSTENYTSERNAVLPLCPAIFITKHFQTITNPNVNSMAI